MKPYLVDPGQDKSDDDFDQPETHRPMNTTHTTAIQSYPEVPTNKRTPKVFSRDYNRDQRIEPQPVPPENEPLKPEIDANARGKAHAPPAGGLSMKEQRGLPGALVFLAIAIVVLIGVYVFGTWKMPESGNEVQSTNVDAPASNE